MREQVCLYMCPWPRIQAAMTDEYALNVTYRVDRGEPRMSFKKATQARTLGEPAGDCIDCQQCVAVCPTGVDIRHGADLGCIQCGLCIDACDEVMEKLVARNVLLLMIPKLISSVGKRVLRTFFALFARGQFYMLRLLPLSAALCSMHS